MKNWFIYPLFDEGLVYLKGMRNKMIKEEDKRFVKELEMSLFYNISRAKVNGEFPKEEFYGVPTQIWNGREWVDNTFKSEE